MTFFFYIAMVLLLSAVASAMYAIATAPEGCEDAAGFHAVRSARCDSCGSGRRSARHADESDHDALPPFLPAR
jgi:hypothetical protein